MRGEETNLADIPAAESNKVWSREPGPLRAFAYNSHQPHPRKANSEPLVVVVIQTSAEPALFPLT